MSRSRSHSSSCVSLENPSSTAPAFVPVASKGENVPADQANVAVLGISRSPTMLCPRTLRMICSWSWRRRAKGLVYDSREKGQLDGAEMLRNIELNSVAACKT